MTKCIGWKTIIRLVIVKYNGITADIPIKHLPVETQILIRIDLLRILFRRRTSGTVKYSIPFIIPKCTPAYFAEMPVISIGNPFYSNIERHKHHSCSPQRLAGHFQFLYLFIIAQTSTQLTVDLSCDLGRTTTEIVLIFSMYRSI